MLKNTNIFIFIFYFLF